jgi:hypothetical protein
MAYIKYKPSETKSIIEDIFGFEIEKMYNWNPELRTYVFNNIVLLSFVYAVDNDNYIMMN